MSRFALSRAVVWMVLVGVCVPRLAVAQSTTNATANVVSAVISGTRDPVTGAVAPGDAVSQTPAFSRDGRLVAFASVATNLGPAPDLDGAPDVYVHVLATGINVPLTTPAVLENDSASHLAPRFSPVIIDEGSGRFRYQLAFISESPGPTGVPNPPDSRDLHDLFVAEFSVTATGDVENVTMRALTVEAGLFVELLGSTLAWSPAGDRIAFLAMEDLDGSAFEDPSNANSDLFVVTLATGAVERITTNDAVGYDMKGLAWSPDGSTIAFDARATDIDVTGDGVNDLTGADTNGFADVFLVRLDLSPRTIERVTSDPVTGDALPTSTGSLVGGFAPTFPAGGDPTLFVSSDIVFPQFGQPAGSTVIPQVVALSPATGGIERWAAVTVSREAAGGPADRGGAGGSVSPVAAAPLPGTTLVGFSSSAATLWDGAQFAAGTLPVPQVYLADGAGPVALLSRAGGRRVPGNGASGRVDISSARLTSADAVFLAGHSPQQPWTLATFATLASNLTGAPANGIQQVVVSAFSPGSPATDDGFRGPVAGSIFIPYELMLANDAPGLSFVGLVAPWWGPTYLVSNDPGAGGVRVDHFGTTRAELISFQYEAEDASGARHIGTVSVNFNNQEPVTIAQTFVVVPGQTLEVAWIDLVNQHTDAEGDPLTLSHYQLIDPGPLGAIEYLASWPGSPLGGFRFTPALSYTGGYEFRYGVIDEVDFGGVERTSFGTSAPIVFTVEAPPLPEVTLALSANSEPEGTAPAPGGVIEFTVTRTGDLSRPSTVTYAVSGGPAPAAAPDDVAGGFAAGSIEFAAGEAVRLITLRAVPDAIAEPDESVAVTLTGATGATIGAAASALGIIRNDDQPPPNLLVDSLSFEDVSGTSITSTRLHSLVHLPVRITNTGVVASDSVVMTVTADLPTIPFLLPTPECTEEPGSAIICTTGSLPPGASRVLRVSFVISGGLSAGQTSTVLRATATVRHLTAPDAEIDLSDNTNHANLTVLDVARPDLRIASAWFQNAAGQHVATVTPGTAVELMVEVENVGDGPSGVVGLSTASNLPQVPYPLTACPIIGISPRCQLPNIAPGTSRVWRLGPISIPHNALPPGQSSVVLTAAVTARQMGLYLETNLSNNTGQAHLTIDRLARPDLRFVRSTFKNASGVPITSARVHDIVHLDVEIDNVGSAATSSTEVTTMLRDVQRNSTSCPFPGINATTCQTGGLLPQASRVVRFTYLILPSTLPFGRSSSVITATSTVRNLVPSLDPETNLSNNTGHASLTVLPYQ